MSMLPPPALSPPPVASLQSRQPPPLFPSPGVGFSARPPLPPPAVADSPTQPPSPLASGVRLPNRLSRPQRSPSVRSSATASIRADLHRQVSKAKEKRKQLTAGKALQRTQASGSRETSTPVHAEELSGKAILQQEACPNLKSDHIKNGKNSEKQQTKSPETAKRKASGVKRPKAPPAKRFRSPTLPMSPLVATRSTGFNTIGGATKNIRDSVKYFKSSQARKQRFEEMVQQVGIPIEKRPPLDVVTRWNSTYQMLNIALKYRRVYESLRQVDPQYTHKPSNEEWKMAKKLCGMLEPFYEATLLVSASKCPTSCYYFHTIWEVKKELEKQSSNSDLVISTMVNEMKAKLKKYWELSYLKICIPVILDPRFKLQYLEFRLNEWFGDQAIRYLDRVRTTFRKLFAEYSSEFEAPVLEMAPSELNDDEDNPWADWKRHQSARQKKQVNELDKYLEEDTLPLGVDFDILQYWKMNSASYPILAHVARDVLAVPASTVASESAFSTGERIISEYRSRLKSETVEALICLQDWIRSNDSTHDNIAGNIIVDDDDCI